MRYCVCISSILGIVFQEDNHISKYTDDQGRSKAIRGQPHWEDARRKEVLPKSSATLNEDPLRTWVNEALGQELLEPQANGFEKLQWYERAWDKTRNSDLWDQVPMNGPPKRKGRLREERSIDTGRRHLALLGRCHLREDLEDTENVLDRGNSSRKGITGMRGGCGKTEGMSRKTAVQLWCSLGEV